MIYKSKLKQPIPWNRQLFVVLHLTSFYHDEVDIFVQHHRARQVQLVGVGLHFKLLSGILQVPNPSREKAMCCNQAGLTSSSNCGTCSPFTNTHLYTAMWTPSVRSSFSFFTFFSFRCSAVSLRAALASSWALWTEDAARRSQSYEPGAERKRRRHGCLGLTSVSWPSALGRAPQPLWGPEPPPCPVLSSDWRCVLGGNANISYVDLKWR